VSKRRFTLFAVGLAFLCTALAGCESGFVTDAARRSLSSFAIDIFNTVVTQTINP
jgi:hypothetical protein